MKKFFQNQRIVFAIAIAIFFTLAILLSASAISKAGQTPTEYGNDFTVFYAAAQNLHYYGDPYNHLIAAKTPYLYLPLFSLLIMPLGTIPLQTAAAIWYWLNIFFALGLLIISTQIVSSKPSEQPFIAITLLILIARLILDNLLWGQVNILVALLISIWLLAEQKSYKWWGELALAIAISIKITPLLLGFYLLIKRRWQELFRLTICFFTITFISLLPLGSKAIILLKGWFNRVILNGEGFNWAYAGNQSLKGAIERLVSAKDTESIYYPRVNLFELTNKESQQVFILLACLLVCYFSYKVTTNKTFRSQVAASCSLMLLLSNLSWKAHFILLTLPLAVLTRTALFGAKTSRFIAVTTLVVFFLITSLTTQPIIGSTLHQWFETHSYYCLITLIIFFLSLNNRNEEKI